MSPSITQTSPPQHPQQPPPPQFMGGPRYGPPPGQPRGPPPRMQGPPQHGPQIGGPPGFMPSGSPRYAPHSGPPQQPHMNQGPMFGPGPDQMGPGPSPNLNRMTPVGGPPQHVVGQPPNGPPPQMVGMPGQQMGPQGPSQVNSMQGAGPPRNGSQGSAGGWQGNVNYNVNSPANQSYISGPGSNQPSQGPMMMGDGSMMEVKNYPVTGGEPSTPHSDEYVMPVPFGQESDQCESAEILKLKQSMQEDTTKMFEKEQSEFSSLDYSDSQNKWT